MISCVIDAMDNYNVKATNRSIDFFRTDMEVMVQVRLYGALAEILLKIDPEKYGDKVIIEMGNKVIYAVLKRAPYMALLISLLF